MWHDLPCQLNLQEPWFDHLTASAQPWPIVFSSMLFTFRRSDQRDHVQCHGWSLAITCYAMASEREPCEGSLHFMENGRIFPCYPVSLRTMLTYQFQYRIKKLPDHRYFSEFHRGIVATKYANTFWGYRLELQKKRTQVSNLLFDNRMIITIILPWNAKPEVLKYGPSLRGPYVKMRA